MYSVAEPQGGGGMMLALDSAASAAIATKMVDDGILSLESGCKVSPRGQKQETAEHSFN